MEIRKAKRHDYQNVRFFYYALTDGLADAEYYAGWEKDVHPTQDFLKTSIASDELYVGIADKRTVASMVLSHDWNIGYEQFQWPMHVAKEEITVIHALGVLKDCTHRGFAKQMVHFAIEEARNKNQKVVRLDVLKGNLPAERLYSGLGFKCMSTVPMYYEDTGWADYELYEYVL